MKKSVIVAACVILAGCATRPSDVAVGPPAYKDGYAPGCDSGLSAGGNPYYHLTKDPQRFLDDKMYAQGWNDGFAACKGQYDAIGQAMRR